MAIAKELRKILWLLAAWKSLQDMTWVGGYCKVWVDEIKDGGWGE